MDKSDHSEEERVILKSVPLTKTFVKVQIFGGDSRIGHDFTVRIYEPNANRDSKNVDRLPLSELEYRGDGGIRTILANPKFDANSAYLLETGPNSNNFEVQIKIPRQLDEKTITLETNIKLDISTNPPHPTQMKKSSSKVEYDKRFDGSTLSRFSIT